MDIVNFECRIFPYVPKEIKEKTKQSKYTTSPGNWNGRQKNFVCDPIADYRDDTAIGRKKRPALRHSHCFHSTTSTGNSSYGIQNFGTFGTCVHPQSYLKNVSCRVIVKNNGRSRFDDKVEFPRTSSSQKIEGGQI